MSSEFDEEFLPYDHPFVPYQWDPERCGYVSADDEMCGHTRRTHIPRTADGDQAEDPGHSGV